jgi:hypothetical protein
MTSKRMLASTDGKGYWSARVLGMGHTFGTYITLLKPKGPWDLRDFGAHLSEYAHVISMSGVEKKVSQWTILYNYIIGLSVSFINPSMQITVQLDHAYKEA